MSDVEHLGAFVLNRHFERCEFFVPETSGDVTVGVVDSIYDPGDYTDFNRFGRSFDVINANVGATNGHGYGVLQILTYFTHDPEYHLFQAVDENGRTRDSYLMEAVGQAMEFEEVDVLNMSVGCDHVSRSDRDCTESHVACSLCEVVEEAVKRGITVVAAAGNHPYVESVCCPSLSDSVVSVGGATTLCTADSGAGRSLNPAPDVFHPPNAYWVEREDGKGAEGAFCSERGCLPGESCQDNRRTVAWENNVPFTTRKPDILAPVHLPSTDDVGPLIREGTSFAAPVVTAGITNLVDWARSAGDDVSAAEIRRAIGDSETELKTTDKPYLSVASLANEVRSERGLPPVDFDDSSPMGPDPSFEF